MTGLHSISCDTKRPSDMDAIEIDYWEHLSATVPALSSPFLSYHFSRAVAEIGRDVRVCVLKEGKRIRGFFPYQFSSLIARTIKFAEPVGGQMTDYFGLIADSDLKIRTDELLQLSCLKCIYFTHLDESQLTYGLTGEKPRVGLRSRLCGDAHNMLEVLCKDKKKYLQDTERRAKQLSRELGPITFHLDVRSKKENELERLFKQKRSQYARTNVKDSLADSWTFRLALALSQNSSQSCRGILSTLMAGDEWVASHFGILGNGILQYWLPVYNPALAKYAPGRLLIHEIIKNAAAAGIHTIDRGEGDTQSKRDLANEEHYFYRGAWVSDSVGGHVASGYGGLKWRFGF